MPDTLVIEMCKAAFIMRDTILIIIRGTTVLKGGVKAVKNGITIPNRRNHFQLPFKQSGQISLCLCSHVLTSSD